jgi:ribonuclease HII
MQITLKVRYGGAPMEAGCDEAGRGCLAGPVVAAAVVLPEVTDPGLLSMLNDSKKLSVSMRNELRPLIEAHALAYGIAMVDNQEIDRINILNASIKAMHLATRKLEPQPGFLLIDGNRFLPYRSVPHKCVVGGDGEYAAIAAASILAKTWRDAYMLDLHEMHPQYNWKNNKGYPTPDHKRAIAEYGTTRFHRRSFKHD